MSLIGKCRRKKKKGYFLNCDPWEDPKASFRFYSIQEKKKQMRDNYWMAKSINRGVFWVDLCGSDRRPEELKRN